MLAKKSASTEEFDLFQLQERVDTSPLLEKHEDRGFTEKSYRILRFPVPPW